MAFGIGLYAPSLILLSLLGLDPRLAFPIMASACAFLMPATGFTFVKSSRIDLKIVLGIAIGGIPARSSPRSSSRKCRSYGCAGAWSWSCSMPRSFCCVPPSGTSQSPPGEASDEPTSFLPVHARGRRCVRAARATALRARPGRLAGRGRHRRHPAGRFRDGRRTVRARRAQGAPARSAAARGRRRLRSGAPRPQRIHRHAPGTRRAADRRRGHPGRRQLRARARTAARREVRRPQSVRQVHLRERHADRPVALSRRPGRSRGAPCLRRRRQPARRSRPRGHGARPRHDLRHGLAHRRRRPHARRRLRPARAALRARARQREGRGHRDGRRATAAREPGREPRPLLGGPRRRRQFRRRHELRVRPAPDAARGRRGRRRVPDRPRARAARFLRRVQLGRARGTAGGLRDARAAGRQAGRRDHRGLLVRAPRAMRSASSRRSASSASRSPTRSRRATTAPCSGCTTGSIRGTKAAT